MFGALANIAGSIGGSIAGMFGGDAIGGTISGANFGSGLSNILGSAGNMLGFVNSAKGTYDSFNNTSLKNQMKYDQFKSELDYQYWSRKMSNRHTLEVGDLRQAGLNPILSANSAFRSSGTSNSKTTSHGSRAEVTTANLESLTKESAGSSAG
jgi:hypothetical protein